MRDESLDSTPERYTPLAAPVEPKAWRLAAAAEPASFFFLWSVAAGAAGGRDEPGPETAFASLAQSPYRGRHGASALAWARAGATVAEDEEDDDTTLSVCGTALFDRTRRESDPGRFVETTELPFITLGTRRAFRGTGARLGDLATVLHPGTGLYVHAIVGDRREVAGAEPSLFLTDHLGLGRADAAIYLVHPESGLGQGTIPTRDQIARRGERLFRRSPVPGAPAWDAILADRFRAELRAAIRPASGRGARALGA